MFSVHIFLISLNSKFKTNRLPSLAFIPLEFGGDIEGRQSEGEVKKNFNKKT